MSVVRSALLAGALAAAFATVGCSSPPSRSDITDALITSGLSEEVARCAADALVDELSDDELVQLTERGGGGAPVDDPDRDDDASDRVRAALTACRDAS